MIYRLLRFIFRLTLNAYFRRKRITGQAKVPNDGPLIFVANHPSAFMDPIAVGLAVNRDLHFIAAGEYVGTGLKAKFFQNQLHMIPVFRPSTMPGDTHKNKEMFEQCYKHLGQGKSLLIFPEGNSITERRLRELRTGVARMAIGASKANPDVKAVQIVPVGLNYSDPHEFRSDLYVQIGDPIAIDDFLAMADEREAVRSLTDLVSSELQATVLHNEKEHYDHFLEQVERIYQPHLTEVMGFNEDDLQGAHLIQKTLINALNHFDNHQPEKVLSLKTKTESYSKNLKSLQLNEESLNELKIGNRPYEAIGLLLLSPLFLLGFLLNALPYFLARVIVQALKIRDSFLGSLAMTIGAFSFLIWYIAGALYLGFNTPLSWYAAALPFIAYGLGIFALKFGGLASRFMLRRRLRQQLQDDQESVIKTLQLRQEIVTDLEELRLAFIDDDELQSAQTK